jgi:hypothetical protein
VSEIDLTSNQSIEFLKKYQLKFKLKKNYQPIRLKVRLVSPTGNSSDFLEDIKNLVFQNNQK